MAKDALERLFEDAMNSSSNNSSSSSQYSIDEQSEVDDDFLDIMSNSSKDTLLSRIQKVELEDELGHKKEEPTVENTITQEENIIEDNIEETIKKEEPIVEQKRGRGRPRKKPLEESITENNEDNKFSQVEVKSTNISTEKIESLNDFMDSLAKDLINELRESNYKTRNFNKKQMEVILKYLENKI